MLSTFPLYISFFTLLITTTLATAPPPPPPYRSIDHILLNCGSSSNTTSPDLLNWEGDTRSKFSPPNFNQVSTPVTADNQESSVPTVPFMTARMIRTPITYSFPVSSGSKFVRLYFYPATYSNFSKETSFVTVKANNFTLLQNFSAFLTVAATANTGYPVFTIIKEFIITVSQNQKLNITLFPEQQNNRNPTHGFINGIEIMSMPDHLYYPPNNMINFINPNGLTHPFKFENNTALENVYRLNVGGRDVSVTEDTGMFRKWQQDYEFLYGQSIGQTPYLSNISVQYTKSTPPYIAPEIVYTTYRTMGNQGLNLNFNLTWLFPVDSGFNYLVRLHFCETQLEVTRENQRVFFIFINNQTAETDFDVIHYSGRRGIPVYKDYAVVVPDQGGREGVKRDLWLALYPNKDSKPAFYDAILNGVEIFKMNRPDGSLAGSNPDPMLPVAEPSVPTSLKKSRGSVPVLTVVGVAVSGCLICALCLVVFLIYRRQRRVKDVDGGTTSETKTLWVPFSYNSKSTKSSTTSSSLPSDLCHRFFLSELRLATSNFHDDFLIGVGGFGNVYRGCIENGSINVAIKRLNPSSKQGVHEFETEIKMLSKLRHMHLVPLLGYSDAEGEMILVYDYMANGTLRDHLYKTDNPPLSWKKRLEICIGAAKGLYYLHTGAKHTIIHRDVKSTNILLDDKLVAKVSDFGLSKVGPTDVSHTHVSTVVKGSFGYLDPEYYRRQQLTEKSDVYSFGVVLLEVLCARPVLIQGISKEQVNLAEWGRICYRKGTLHHIIDKNLKGQIASESLEKFIEIANNCLKDEGTERPTMGDVVWTLEFALQLQETAEEKIKNECSDVGMDGMTSIVSTSTLSSDLTSTNDSDDMLARFSEQLSSSHKKSSDTLMTDDRKSDSNLTMGNESVFSEINNPRGR